VNEFEVERFLRARPPDEPAYPGNVATLLARRRVVPGAGVPASVDLAPSAARPRRWMAASVAAVAAVAVLIAGLALLTRSREQPPPATAPSSTSSPTTAAPATTTPETTAPPAGATLELFDRWVGPPRPTPSAQQPIGPAIVEITDDTLVLETGEFDNPTAFGSQVQVEDDTLVLRTLGEGGGCSPGDLGRYHWTVAEQSTLTLTVESDACVARQAIAGSWTHTACPNPASDCLGPVPAGDYASVMFDPLGTASYGELRFTLPAGWQESSDSKVNLTLATAGTTIALYTDPVVDPR
jgi:hypothetical protein